jgi:uncharacterized protein (TIGR03083 family)
MSPKTALGELYRHARLRTVALVVELDAVALRTPVPTCPGWSVRDVVAHLTSLVEDARDGALSGPPSADTTRAQVARWEGREADEMVAVWTALAPSLEAQLNERPSWPAVLDVASHEQDIRGALHRPGSRDAEVIRTGSRRLVQWLQPPVPMRVVLDDQEIRVGPEEGTVLQLRTDHFDAFRWRMGRRSRRQLAAMDWTGDPSPVLDHLAVFGPAEADIDE